MFYNKIEIEIQFKIVFLVFNHQIFQLKIILLEFIISQNVKYIL